MRDTSQWQQSLIRRLQEQWPQNPSLTPSDLCNIELGLYSLSQLVPSAPAKALWVLLTGYPFPVPESKTWGNRERQMLSNIRHILPFFRSRYQWERALENYCQLEERVRGYEIDSDKVQFAQRDVTLCSNRVTIYQRTLSEPLAYSEQSLNWVTESDTYLFFTEQSYLSQVEIPPEFIFPPPTGYDLTTGKTKRNALTVTWDELLATARWMDSKLKACGLLTDDKNKRENILSRVQLECFAQTDTSLQSSKSLTLDGIVHLIGMVSSGKSTLMDVLAVWASRQGLHVTLVIGDVIGALNRAELFANLGLTVAPILGASNRKKHTERLHRAWAADKRATDEDYLPRHVGFNWLSTACPLDGLQNNSEPLETGKQPCRILYKQDDRKLTKAFACSLYRVCPFHQAQRDLVNASIWIATPASLVYSRIPPQLNQEYLRFIELVYRHSDLVIIDEADRVQVQLDMTFSPNEILVNRGNEAWLNKLYQCVVTALNEEGREQLRDENVDFWCQAHDVVQRAASRIYGLLLREDEISRWVKNNDDFFTDWLLFNDLADKLIVGRAKSRREGELDPVTLPPLFEDYINDPMGDRNEHFLANLAQRIISAMDDEDIRSRLRTWIGQQELFTTTLSQEELTTVTVQLEFAILVAILQNRLNSLMSRWKKVEEPLHLEEGGSMMFHRPPKEHQAIIPSSPMGNVLGFQYSRTTGDQDAPGDLRFFRCMGVGRWLLLHLHELFAADNVVGPYILLLSGTSWAGTSPGYHIQIPVTGVLRSPEEEVNAIAESHFEFLPFYNNEGKAIKVSGKQGNDRLVALNELLYKLASRGGLDGLSRLEQERERLPEGRQRILLVVGSYLEAKHAREFLEKERSDWRSQVLNLVSDDETFDSDWFRSDNNLQRGVVDQFAETEAWILIAPLLAIERGHNILNRENQAAIGAAYFLVRPHPRPDDISFAIHSINRWAIEQCKNADWFAQHCQNEPLSLEKMGQIFRKEAYKRWRFLLHVPMIYGTLPPDEREAVIWNQLVILWQVIGRLVRGGNPAHVFFCDVPFAYRSANQEDKPDEPKSSLLVGIISVLQPYFTDHSNVPEKDKALVQALYGPFYQAMKNIKGI